jgi:nitrilase
MSSNMQPVKVGAVQADPVCFDLQGGVDKTISIIQKAAADGVNVLGFPEVFIPGYPWCISSLPFTPVQFGSDAIRCRSIWITSVLENVELIHKYMNNSLEKNSPETRRICEAVKEAGMFVVLGYSERAGASLYISQSLFHKRRTSFCTDGRSSPFVSFLGSPSAIRSNWWDENSD